MQLNQRICSPCSSGVARVCLYGRHRCINASAEGAIVRREAPRAIFFCNNMSGIVPRPLIRSGYETNEKPNGYVWADRPSDDVN